jgi:hypothetical protein
MAMTSGFEETTSAGEYKIVKERLVDWSVVIHATVLCVDDLKEIVHMDVLKASKDTIVLSQVV